MMHKLKLVMDDLRVESFDTSASRREKGTVFGEQCTCQTVCTCPGCATCDETCPATCAYTCDDASCAGTCGGSCGDTCNDSCGGSCFCSNGGVGGGPYGTCWDCVAH